MATRVLPELPMPVPPPRAARRRRFLLAAAWLAAGVATLAAPASSAAAKRRSAPLPGWSLIGTYDLPVDVGFVSLSGSYDFSFEDQTGSISLAYNPQAELAGNGIVGVTFFGLVATSTVGEDGLQHVSIVDTPKNPTFAFDGVVQPNGRDIAGQYLRSGGFAGLEGTVQGSTTFRRTQPAIVQQNFRLRMTTTMDRKGRVRGAVGPDKKEIRSGVDVYPGRTFDGGLVRGKVTTSAADGTTTAKLKIRGKGWLVTMAGPVDVDGFHALAAIRAGGFDVADVPLVLPVTEGPQPPPPPPPPDPDKYRRATGGSASVVAGAVQITKSGLPVKFFKRKAGVTIEFPSSGIAAPMVADPSTASTSTPIRFFVKIGSATYGTAAAGGSVTLTVKQYSPVPGGGIEILCEGTVADARGRTKKVDLLLDASVGQ